MEPTTIFTALVGFISIFHLLSSVVNAHSKKRSAVEPGIKKKRGDWYVFFKISDLTGQNGQSSQKREQQLSNEKKERYEQRRRQHAKRPKLHA